MAHIRKRVTQAVVLQLTPNQTVRDTDIKGFGVRNQKGTASYFLQTYINGRLRWMTIGPHGAPWTPASARKEAKRLLNEIAAGINPTAERKKKRSIPTVAEAADSFIEDHSPKLTETTVKEYQRHLRDYIIPVLGNCKVSELDKSLISRAHNSWKDKLRTANCELRTANCQSCTCGVVKICFLDGRTGASS